MARLNELLKYGPSYFYERLLASHQIRCLKKCAIVTLHNYTKFSSGLSMKLAENTFQGIANINGTGELFNEPTYCK